MIHLYSYVFIGVYLQSICFHSYSIDVHCVLQFVFMYIQSLSTGGHLCSISVHSFSICVLSCSICAHFYSICVHSCFIRVHQCSLCVHSCSIRVHSCSICVNSCSVGAHSCSIGVPLCSIRVHLYSICVHLCSTFVHSCSICVHSCSLMFDLWSDLCGVLDMIFLFGHFQCNYQCLCNICLNISNINKISIIFMKFCADFARL